MSEPDPEVLTAHLLVGCCPWCGRGGWKCVAHHIVRAHGIPAKQLREMAGLPIGESLSSPELREQRSEITRAALRENPQRLEALRAGALSSSHRGYKFRRVSIARVKAVANTPEAKERARRTLAAIDRSAGGRSRSPEALAAGTERLLKWGREHPEEQKANVAYAAEGLSRWRASHPDWRDEISAKVSAAKAEKKKRGDGPEAPS